MVDLSNGRIVHWASNRLGHIFLGRQAVVVICLVNVKQRVSMAIGHALHTFALRE